MNHTEARDQKRADGRGLRQLRPVRIESPFFRHAEGSASIRLGETWVVCAATVEPRLPQWLRGASHGWVSAEYGLLPRSVPDRAPRNRISGRTLEIQRLVGRSLRAVTDLHRLGDRLILVDCDVIEADGGTRTAAVTAAYVALHQLCRVLWERGEITGFPLPDQLAAVSVGLKDGEVWLDLTHAEDSAADVDFNVVMTGGDLLVEVQGTAEHQPFSRGDLGKMLTAARGGIRRLLRAQRRALPWVAPPGTGRGEA
ncbi:MAG: ribonuclease PH [Candidatus Eisenbacteria bacterium]|nr:ribonuclease PH [Candidatus Eisenbacteria bacterium]